MGDDEHLPAAERTRRKFIEAGWTMLDGVGFADALAGVTVAEIAAHAGRSERTFWNHFADWDSYIEALQTAIPSRGPMESEDWGAVDVVDEALVGPTREALPALVRAAASGNWEEVNQPEEMKAFRRQLLLASRTAAHGGLPDVLGHDYYGSYLPRLQAIYESTGAAARVAPIGGITWSGVTRIIAALAEGLQMQSMARQDEVDADFVADALTVVGLGLLAPVEAGESIGGREAAFAAQPAPLAEDPELVDLARRCPPGTAEEPLRWPGVARATGLEEFECRARFQRLSVVSALGFTAEWRPHDPEGPGADHPPAHEVFDLLCHLARSARRAPERAAALLAERLAPGGDGDTVTALVPLGTAVAAAAGEPRRAVHERMVNTALCCALSDRSASPAETASVAVGTHRRLAAELSTA